MMYVARSLFQSRDYGETNIRSYKGRLSQSVLTAHYHSGKRMAVFPKATDLCMSLQMQIRNLNPKQSVMICGHAFKEVR